MSLITKMISNLYNFSIIEAKRILLAMKCFVSEVCLYMDAVLADGNTLRRAHDFFDRVWLPFMAVREGFVQSKCRFMQINIEGFLFKTKVLLPQSYMNY